MIMNATAAPSTPAAQCVDASSESSSNSRNVKRHRILICPGMLRSQQRRLLLDSMFSRTEDATNSASTTLISVQMTLKQWRVHIMVDPRNPEQD